jgi:hypothetical protein
LEQPVALPVMLTGVPPEAVETGDAEALIAEQGGVVVSTYWKALKASYLFGLVPEVPGLLASRAQTEKR